MTPIAGTDSCHGNDNGDGGASKSANLHYPHGIAFDKQNNQLYVSEIFNNRIRKIDLNNGVISSIHVTSSAAGLLLDSDNNLLVAAADDHRIAKIDLPRGVVSYIAGTGESGLRGDYGLALMATFMYPIAIALDSFGNLLIVDQLGNNVRKVNMISKNIITVAGSATGVPGAYGDGGQAVAALLHQPSGIAVDINDDLFIVDSFNNKVRKVVALTGVINTIAGTGFSQNQLFGDHGLAISATLRQPKSILLDNVGGYYVSDYCAIRYVNVDGVITTVAGSGPCGDSSDRLATAGELFLPAELTRDSDSNLIIADYANHKVQKVVGIFNDRSVGRTLTEENISLPVSHGSKSAYSFNRYVFISFSVVLSTVITCFCYKYFGHGVERPASGKQQNLRREPSC